MSQTSSIITAGVTASVAGVAPLVEWIANVRLGLQMPPQVVLIVTAVLLTISHFLANVANTLWNGWVEKNEPTDMNSAPTTVTREAGFVRLPAILGLLAISLICVGLAGCGTVNAWMSARQTMVEQDYKGLKSEVQKNNDDKLDVAIDLLCSTSLGALQRASGKPNVVDAALTACPLPNMTTLHGSGGNVTMYAPNTATVSLNTQPTVATAVQAQAVSSVPAATATDQALQSIQQSLKAIQSAITPVTPKLASKTPAASLPVPQPKPAAPSGATVPTAAPTAVTPAPSKSAAATPAAASPALPKSLLSAPQSAGSTK